MPEHVSSLRFSVRSHHWRSIGLEPTALANHLQHCRVLTYRTLNGAAPSNSSYLSHVADVPSRQRVGSASCSRQTVSSFCLSTDGLRAFPVSGVKLCNELPLSSGSIWRHSCSVGRNHAVSLIWHFYLYLHLYWCGPRNSFVIQATLNHYTEWSKKSLAMFLVLLLLLLLLLQILAYVAHYHNLITVCKSTT